MAGAVIELKNPPRILSSAAVGGEKEGKGPYGDRFDQLDPTGRFGKMRGGFFSSITAPAIL